MSGSADLPVLRVRRCSPVVEAIVYDGSFPLEFLRPDEYVALSGSQPGGAVIVSDGKVLVTVSPGMVLVRESEDTLLAIDRDTFDGSYEEVEAGA
jgi:hypothetical protein